jgi:hypothetical protein
MSTLARIKRLERDTNLETSEYKSRVPLINFSICDSSKNMSDDGSLIYCSSSIAPFTRNVQNVTENCESERQKNGTKS